ncbi:MAG: trypsin-like peptidase domain-containing protein [Clostridia bacterium]|nr:trypsin-like peptidase domain-containing protein [Clostridia bacterium]
MNKTIKNVLAVTGALLMGAGAFVLVAVGIDACRKEEKDVINAYDIAVQAGFQGTEQEWLNSLKGSNGKDGADLDIEEVYEAAQKHGYTGTFLEFLKEYFSAEVQEDNDTTQISENMMSVVSIYCGFTKTTVTDSGWPLFTPKEETETYAAAGSGVIVDLNKEAGNAYIITNYHVIYDNDSDTKTGISDSIYLYTYGAYNAFSSHTGKDENGDGMKATYVGGAMDYDIAILKVEGSEQIKKGNFTEAKMGNSDLVEVGEKVFAIGNPDGAGISVTSGLISVDSEYITMSATDGSSRSVDYRVMRTDTAINSGNSGGGLFNTKGELIGITNAKSIESGVDNVAYALPITQVKYLYENILENGGVLKRAMLGVMVATTASESVYENGVLSKKETFQVYYDEDKPSTTVIQETAAAYNKLRYFDVFVSMTVNGKTTQLTRRFQLNDLLLTVRKGDVVTLRIIRDGTEMDVSINYDNDQYFVQYN